MTLAELEQKVKDALANNTGFTEQVKVTLLVVWEQITALKTLDGYYSKEISEFKELNAKNKELTEQATQLLDTATELMDKVTTSRAEAEKIINSRIDALLVPLVYKSDYAVKANQIVIYADTLYLAKEAFTTTSWANDKSKLVALSGGSAGGGIASNAYTAGKEIKTGEIITYQNKAYIAQSEFVASTWEADKNKFVLLSGADAYPAGKEIKKGDFITYESVIYVATADFTSSTWETDSANFVKFSADTSKSVDYLAGLSIVKGDIIAYNSKFYIATESFTASDWTTDEAKFVPFTNENSDNAYAAGKSFALGQIVVYNDKAYVANEAFTATDWATDEAKCTPLSNTTDSLANYYTKEQIDLLLAMKMDLLTAGEGVAIEKKDGEIIVGVLDYQKIIDTLKSINVNFTTGTQMGLKCDFTKIGVENVAASEYITPIYDAVGASTQEIMDFLGLYPLILSPDGQEFKKLDANDYSKAADGTDMSAFIITLGNDVMVNNPLRGMKLERQSADVGELAFTTATSAQKAGFAYNAHHNGDKVVQNLYIGAYEAYASAGKLYSTSGQYPAANATLATFRNYAAARGEGYRIIDFYQRQYLNAVYLLIHQDLNSQRACGMGFVNMSAASKTGLGNAYGANGELIKASNPTYLTDGKHAVKCAYYENLWGNVWERCDGFVLNGLKLSAATGNFNDAGLGYKDLGYAYPHQYEGDGANIVSVAWDNERGFYPTQLGSNNNAYFCDTFGQKSGCSLIAGASWFKAAQGGVFCIYAAAAASYVAVDVGSRLVKM